MGSSGYLLHGLDPLERTVKLHAKRHTLPHHIFWEGKKHLKPLEAPRGRSLPAFDRRACLRLGYVCHGQKKMGSPTIGMKQTGVHLLAFVQRRASQH